MEAVEGHIAGLAKKLGNLGTAHTARRTSVSTLGRWCGLVAAASWLCPAAIEAQLSIAADVALRGSYEWRGFQLDPGTNLQYATYLSIVGDRVKATAGVWSLTDLSRGTPGIPARWFHEVSPWVEITIGNPRLSFTAGATGYRLKTDSESRAQRRPLRAEELYASLRGGNAWLIGDLTFFYEVENRGAYGEIGLGPRIPLWTGATIPVGSLFLDSRIGVSLQSGPEEGEVHEYLFAESGFTHVTVAPRLTLLPFALPFRLAGSPTLEFGLTRGLDPKTERVGYLQEGVLDRWRWSWMLGLQVTFPRCRPERELCRDL
jgi:hypothetical protein